MAGTISIVNEPRLHYLAGRVEFRVTVDGQDYVKAFAFKSMDEYNDNLSYWLGCVKRGIDQLKQAPL